MTAGMAIYIRVAVFDIGETLVDETRAWFVQAQAGGVTALTLFAALGALIERGEDHRRVWALLGVEPPPSPPRILPEDFYPDPLPCLQTLTAAGLTVGLAGNQPASAEYALAELGLPGSFIASSARWGVEKPSPESSAWSSPQPCAAPNEIAYIGDRLDNDVLPARRAGLFSVFVRRGPWGYLQAHRPDLAAANAVIDSLSELPPLITDHAVLRSMTREVTGTVPPVAIAPGRTPGSELTSKKDDLRQ